MIYNDIYIYILKYNYLENEDINGNFDSLSIFI